MNVTPSAIYWITRCTPVQGLMTAVIACAVSVLLFAAITFAIATGDEYMKEETRESVLKYCATALKFSLVFLVVGTILRTLTPSTKEIAAILVIPRIANSETVQELGSGVVDLAKEWINELHPNKKGDK